jgi:hypothetical protein
MIEGNEEEVITKHMLSGNVSPNSPKGIYILHILGESGIIQFHSVISAFLILLKERHGG